MPLPKPNVLPRSLALTVGPALVTALMTALPTPALPTPARATPARATGPSFDCAQANAPVDRAICADSDLADLDVSLETSFRAALNRDPAGKTRLLDRQRQWLAARASDCNFPKTSEASSDNRMCLRALYTARIAMLETGSRPDAPLCHGIADRIGASNGYLANASWTALGKGLSDDPKSPVRFTQKGEQMNPTLFASLPHDGDNTALRHATIYRIGARKSVLAAETIEGSMSCQTMAFFKVEGGVTKAIDDPVAQDETDYCWTSTIYVGDRLPPNDRAEPTPLFANEKYAIGKSSLDLWERQDGAWHPACHIEATYDTELDVNARFCRPGVPCAALEVEALALAKARDKAASDTPPQTLGAATLAPSKDGDQPNELPNFGQDGPSGYDMFETGAPLYAESGPNGPITMRISHGALGWRTDENYLVGVYERKGTTLEPIAGFMIHDRRIKLRAATAQ